MGRFFDKLSTPAAAAVILICFLAVNGFLLYRQFATPTVSTPLAPSTPSIDTAGAPEESSELERHTPGAPATSTEEASAASERSVLGDLSGSVRQCDGDRKECVRKLVTEALPEATYIGGRTDLNVDGSGRNKEILYFEDPNLGTCEHVTQEYVISDRLVYAVIVLGQGTFESERGSECIPEA